MISMMDAFSDINGCIIFVCILNGAYNYSLLKFKIVNFPHCPIFSLCYFKNEKPLRHCYVIYRNN